MKASKKSYLVIGLAAFSLWLILFKTAGIITQNFSTEAYHTPLDYIIPITPLFVWPYAIAYIIPFAPFLWPMDYRAYNKTLIAVFLATTTAFWMYAIFPFWITQPELGPSLSERLLQLQYDIDFKPGANKMPALHVVLPLLIATYFGRLPKGPFFKSVWYILVALICVSALFTKQHVVIDVAVGLLWAGLAWTITSHMFRKHNLDEPDPIVSLKKAIFLFPRYWLLASIVIAPAALGLKWVL